jgi:hypothetical protein
MTWPTHRFLALLITAGIILAGCGGGSGHPAGGTSGQAVPPPVTHADPVTLLPSAGEAGTLIRPQSRPSRYDQRLNSSTLSSAFSSRVPASARLASGTAELDAVGRNGTFLYAHAFEFKSQAGAQSLTGVFLSATRLRTALGRPSGAPGQEGEASSQPYGRRQMSYRYAFRDHNVLSYVELDGPRGKYSVAEAVRLATLQDQHIRAALG